MSKKSELSKITVGCKSKPFVLVWISSIHPVFCKIDQLVCQLQLCASSGIISSTQA